MYSPSFETIKNGLSKKSNEELLKIWVENDCYSWTNEAFSAVKEILIEQNIDLPEQNPVPEKPKKKDVNSNTKYGIACVLGGIIVLVVSMMFGSTLILPYGLIGYGILVLTKEGFF